jgi:hypothetical protein
MIEKETIKQLEGGIFRKYNRKYKFLQKIMEV